MKLRRYVALPVLLIALLGLLVQQSAASWGDPTIRKYYNDTVATYVLGDKFMLDLGYSVSISGGSSNNSPSTREARLRTNSVKTDCPMAIGYKGYSNPNACIQDFMHIIQTTSSHSGTLFASRGGTIQIRGTAGYPGYVEFEYEVPCLLPGYSTCEMHLPRVRINVLDDHYQVYLDASEGSLAGTNTPTDNARRYYHTAVYREPYSIYTPLPTPTRAKYSFAGWYTARTGGTRVTDSTIFNNRDAILNQRTVTLYAHWNKWDKCKVTKQATCTTTGTKTYTYSRTGERWQETIPALGHNWDGGVITKAPTYTATGVKTFTCSRCKLTRTQTLAKLPKLKQSMTISSPASVLTGKSIQLTAKNAVGTVTYSSSNPRVACVTNKGVIKGVSPGSAVITVKASGGNSHLAAVQTRTIYVFKDATPSISSVVNVNGGLKISWSKISTAALYRLYYKVGTTGGSTGWTKLCDTRDLSYIWKGGKSGVYYTFMIRCIDTAGSFTSDFYSKGYTRLYLAAPTPSKITNSSAGTITVSWAQSAGCDGYVIQYSTDKTFKSGEQKIQLPASAVSVTIQSLKKGTTYFVRMYSYKGTGNNQLCSAWGTVKSIRLNK